MIFFSLLKPRFKSILIIIFVTVHLSACGTEEFLTAIAPEIGSAIEADIVGINHAAKINGVDSGNLIEDVDPDGDNLLEVSGKLNITDNDAGEDAFIAKTVNGDYGVFDIDTVGNWNYATDNRQSAIQNLASNASLTENLTVSSVDGTTHSVEITIIGIIDSGNLNNAAVITGNDHSNIQEDSFTYNNQVRSIGKLNITDRDAGQAAFIVVAINGNYGTLNIDISGNWFYVLNNSLPAIQSLNEVDSVNDTLVISSVDGTTHNITITIWGANEVNQTAKITGVDTGTVTEDVDPDGDNLLEVSGKLHIKDNDAGEEAFIANTVNGDYGVFDIDTVGNWNYATDNRQSAIQNLASNATLTENLMVSSVDGTTHTVKIKIIGVIDSGNLNNAAVITGNDHSNIQEDSFTYNNQVRSIGKLNITDRDAGQAAFIVVAINGNYGTLNIDISGNWFYVLNNSLPAIQSLNEVDSVNDTLVISSVDGTTHNITITIWGANDVNQPAIISGTDSASVTEDISPFGNDLLEVGGALNITDSDAGEAAFIVNTHNSNHGNYGQLVISAEGNWWYYADNNQTAIQNLATGATLTDSLTVSSVDGTTHTIVITIVGVNETNNNTATVNLSWVAPSEREDNQPISLSEINGYKVYYGTTPGQYPNKVTINDGTAVGHTFTNFPKGTHYFVVTTFDTAGRESRYSTITTVN